MYEVLGYFRIYFGPGIDSNVYVSSDSEAQKTWNIAAFEQIARLILVTGERRNAFILYRCIS